MPKPASRRYCISAGDGIPTFIFSNLLRAGVVAIVGWKSYTNMPDHPFYALGWLLLGGSMVLPKVSADVEVDENEDEKQS
jgi:hypothetical protein